MARAGFSRRMWPSPSSTALSIGWRAENAKTRSEFARGLAGMVNLEIGMVATGQSRRWTRAEKSLLSFLVRTGALDAATAGEVQTWAEQKQIPVAQALTTHGLLSDEQLAGAIAKGLRLPLLNLDAVPFDDDISRYVKE